VKGLIFGTLYLYDAADLEFMAQWRACQEASNPGWPLLLVDAGSYWRLRTGHDPLHDFEYRPIGEQIESGILLTAPGTIVSFSDNVGHLARHGRDGWGRAFCQGLQIAIDNGFDYVAHVEGDVLSSVAWERYIALLEQHDKAVLVTGDPVTRCLETGLMLFRTPWLVESDFIARYAWDRKVSTDIPEDDVADLCLQHMLAVDIPGCRNDSHTVMPAEVDSMLYLTHCRDRTLYTRFMQRFGRPRET
jgi:hypothetical protein